MFFAAAASGSEANEGLLYAACNRFFSYESQGIVMAGIPKTPLRILNLSFAHNHNSLRFVRKAIAGPIK